MFNHAKNITIEGGTFTAVQGDYHSHSSEDKNQLALEKLLLHVAPGAFHNSEERFDAPKCHPNTRTSIIETIKDWIKNPNNQCLILWLYGPAGAGKSAIAQTIAELCQDDGTLAASFFFSRSAAMRNDKIYLIATLAYQIISSIPEMAEHVFNAINANPTIFSLSLAAQIDALIVRPLKAASSQFSSTRLPMLVVIDGLDECGGLNAQTMILDALLQAIPRLNVPIYFLIASRPEQEIRDAFHTGDRMSRVLGLALDASYFPDADIQLFLSDKFDDIKQKHPSKKSIPADWPSPNGLADLVSRASGQFIYASTVVKFVESRYYRPVDRLNIVLGLIPSGNATPFAELDALYTEILEAVHADHIEKVLEIFAFIILHTGRNLYMSASDIESMLEYQPGDLNIFLADVHALVSVSEIDHAPKLHHASLSDYLSDQSRSGKFFINAKKAHTRFATGFSRSLRKLPVAEITISSQHLIRSTVFHASRSELSVELMDALYGLDLATMVGNIDNSFRYDVYGNLPQDFDRFMEWLGNEHDVDPSQRLLRYHSGTLLTWLLGAVTNASSNLRQDVCAMFALLSIYQGARILDILDILEAVHITPPSFRERLLYWTSSGPYITSLLTCVVTDPQQAGVHLVNGKVYAAFAGTMSTFLINRTGEWSILCDVTLETLLRVLPRADGDDVLERSLRRLLMSLQFTNNDIGFVEPRRSKWKSRLIILGVKCLEYIKKQNLPYSDHAHEKAYDVCIWCDASKEVDKIVTTSGVPAMFRLKKKI